MKRQILLTFYFLMAYLGVIKFFYWLNCRKEIVLTYHNIIPDEFFDGSCHLGVSHAKSVFESQIQLIKKRFSLRGKEKNRGRCLITFDDGYKNQFEIAAKTLNCHGLQGIFFIAFESLITGQPLIIDKIMMWVSYVPVNNYTVLGKSIMINNFDRSLIASELYNKLTENYELWDVIESELNNAFPFDDLPISSKLVKLRFKPLEPNDLDILAKSEHVVAAHSWSHRPLSILPYEQQKEDFSRCALLAQKYCNSKLYSYPFGGDKEVSQLTAKLCAEHGFSAAYLNIPTSPAWCGVNANYILPRLSLPNEKNKHLLDAKLSGFESFCKKLLKKRVLNFIIKG